MNNGGRFALLACSVVLLLVGVVCLRHRIGPTRASPAFMPGNDPVGTNAGGATRPTILTADPASELTHPTVSNWRDPEPIPVGEFDPPPSPHYPSPQTPASRGTSRGYPFVPRVAPPSIDGERIPVPSGAASVEEKADATLSSDPLPHSTRERTTETAAIAPTTEPVPVAAPRITKVLTIRDDSLWSISERIYGNGLYYQALYALNRDRIPRPDRIGAGIEVLTPPPEELHVLYPKLCPDVTRRGS